MRNKILFVLIAATVLFHSCDKAKYIGLKTIDVDYKNRTNGTVSGKTVDLGVMGVDNIYIYDTLLMVTTTDPNGMLSVYNIDSQIPLANLCKRGRAQNEFLRPTCYSKQLYVKNGDIIIPLRDDEPVLKEVNVTQSIAQQTTVINDRIDCIPNSHGRYLLIDNDLNNQFVNLDAYPRNGEVIPPRYYISKDGNEDDMNVFPRLMTFEDESDAEFYYYGEIYKHPSRNIVVQPMLMIDYIFFFDLDHDKYFAIHQKGSKKIDDEVVSHTMETSCFQGVAVSEDIILVLYFAGDYAVNASDYSTASPELLLFDWEGNYLTGVKLDKRVKDIAYDPKHHVVYGINRLKDEIYSFDISEVVERIK